ncbi:MAG: HEAT repeat domain-containing protein [Anaerolineae bacterium]|nr:HEAT repeat domain-containing protein [Anaerolineae bacterium]
MTQQDRLQQAMMMLELGDIQDRLDALTIVTEERHLPAVPLLVTWLPNADPGTRYLIVKSLTQLPHDDAVPVLLDALRWDDMWTRAAITAALIANGSVVVIDGLMDALRDEKNAVRRAAAKALGKIEIQAQTNTHTIVMRGLSAALLDVDDGVRRFAAEALGRLGAEGKVSELSHALNDKDATVRIAAFRALANIDTPEARNAVRQWSKQ